MSSPILLLTRRLLVGAFPIGGIILPDTPVFSISASFNDVVVTAANTVAATFTITRVGGLALSPTVTWKLVPAAINPLTSGYLADPTVLTGKTVAFGPGVTSVSVSITFAAIAQPSVDLQASVVLTASSVGSAIDAGFASFPFIVDKAPVGPAGDYDLGPDYTANATLQTGSGGGIVVTQEGDGIVIDCASVANDQTQTNIAALLWWKTPRPAAGGWKLGFSYTELDGHLAATSNGVYFQVFPGFSGGRNGSDANPNLWTTAQYRDPLLSFQANTATLDRYGTGLRFSMDQDAINPANSDQLRGHQIIADGTEGNLGGAAYASSFPFVTGTEYRVEVTWDPVAGSLTWVKTDPLGAAVTVVVTDPAIATYMGNYLGIGVSDARKARIRAATLDAVNVVNPPASFEDDPAQWATSAVQTAQPSTSVTSSNLASTLGNTSAGNRYVIGADIVATGTSIVIDGQGTITAPVVVEGDQTNMASFRKLSLKQITVNNAAHVYFRNVDIGSTQIIYTGTSHHISFEKFLAYGRTGGCNNPSFSLGTGDGMTDPLRYLRWRYFVYGKAGVRTTSNMIRMWSSPKTGYQFPNHPRYMYTYRGRFTNVSQADGFTPIITMAGSNERDYYRDLQWGIYENLIDNVDSNTIVEIKYTGVTYARNTYERGTAGLACYARNRHSVNTYIGNLFVTRAGSPPQAGRGGIAIRDKNCVVLNNHAYTLADGVQPTLDSPAGAPEDKIGLYTGNLDATLYPTNEGDGTVGQFWMHALGTKCGGNNMPVIVGDSGGGSLPAVNCIVPGAGGGRVDRNKSVSIVADRDYAGRGKYRLASTGSPVYVGPPAYGTLIGTSTTDSGTSLVPDGADITQVPVRLTQATVGPGAAP